MQRSVNPHHLNTLIKWLPQPPTAYLKWEVGDDAGDSKANKEYVGEDKSSGGIDDLLDPFVRATGLPRLSDRTKEENIKKNLRKIELFVLP